MGIAEEINTSAFVKVEAKRHFRLGIHKMSLVSPSLMQSVSQLLTLQPCPELHQSGPWWDKDLQGIEAASSGRERNSWRVFDVSGAKVKLQNKELTEQVITYPSLVCLFLTVVCFTIYFHLVCRLKVELARATAMQWNMCGKFGCKNIGHLLRLNNMKKKTNIV